MVIDPPPFLHPSQRGVRRMPQNESVKTTRKLTQQNHRLFFLYGT